MFIEIDVSAGDNCSESLMLMFNGLSDPVPTSRVFTTDPTGTDQMCAVIGWSSQGACPAYSATVEESGEGSAVLVYGGDEGIRLNPSESEEEWDVTSPYQWGEPCLLLPKDTEVR